MLTVFRKRSHVAAVMPDHLWFISRAEEMVTELGVSLKLELERKGISTADRSLED